MGLTYASLLLAVCGLSNAIPLASPPDPGPLMVTPIPGKKFKEDPLWIAKLTAPAWHMDEDMCMPTSAVEDGKQVAAGGGFAIEDLLNDGCEAPDKNREHGADPHPFPTYYNLQYCEADDSWRVVYDVFWIKDAYHEYDWEWAAARFVKPNKSVDEWARDGLWMERDGYKPYVKWVHLQNTFSYPSDIDQDYMTGRGRPKLYFGKWRHSVWDFPEYSIPADVAQPKGNEYRSDDFRQDAASWLVKSTDLDENWNWGDEADSFPRAFDIGGKYDICKLETKEFF